MSWFIHSTAFYVLISPKRKTHDCLSGKKFGNQSMLTPSVSQAFTEQPDRHLVGQSASTSDIKVLFCEIFGDKRVCRNTAGSGLPNASRHLSVWVIRVSIGRNEPTKWLETGHLEI